MRTLRIITLFLITSLGGLALQAEEQPNPYAKPDNSWLRLTGKVESPAPESFRLDYGDGWIMVEVDDWDNYLEGTALSPGDLVTVYGQIDDDFYEVASVEATSIYVENQNSFIYANDADEEDVSFPVNRPMEVSILEMRGTVAEVRDGKFMLDTGADKVEVDVDTMTYDPLDEKGFQKLEVGDRVSVSGRIDSDFFSDREMNAISIITLSSLDNSPPSS